MNSRTAGNAEGNVDAVAKSVKFHGLNLSLEDDLEVKFIVWKGEAVHFTKLKKKLKSQYDPFCHGYPIHKPLLKKGIRYDCGHS